MIAFATLVVYLWVAPEFIVYGDNAELSALGVIGGAAHPSGYPLYLLWLRAWSWLPSSSPAHAAAMATAILAALQALILHASCRAWGARAWPATVAVGVFAAGPIALRLQSEAEVFALNGLVCATVLWIAAKAGPLRGVWRAAVLGLVAGLGLSNHLTCVLVAPVGILGVVRGIRESNHTVALGIGTAVLGVVIGLLPYVYLLITPDTWISWGKISSLSDLVHHFLRLDYGPVGQFSPHPQDVSVGESFLAFCHSLGRAYLWFLAPVAVAALGWFVVRRDRIESRVAWAMLAASWLVAGPLLVMRFNVKPVHLGLYVVQRFHLLALLLLVIPLAVGIDRLVGDRDRRLSQRLRSSRALHSLITVGGFLALIALSLPSLARGHSPAIEQGLSNMLRTLPRDAILIGATDEFHFGLGYLQGALGVRRDVAVISVPQVGLSFYRERIRQRTGIVITAAEGDERVSVLIATQALDTKRPLFIDPYQANIAAAYPTYPYGLVFRVLPAGTVPPPIEQVFAINRDLYARYIFGYEVPGADDQLATQFHFHYARAWRTIAEGLAHAGRREEQALALEYADALAPR